MYQRKSVPIDSATWHTDFFADANVTLSCCSGEERRVPVKPGKNSTSMNGGCVTEPKHSAQNLNVATPKESRTLHPNKQLYLRISNSTATATLPASDGENELTATCTP